MWLQIYWQETLPFTQISLLTEKCSSLIIQVRFNVILFLSILLSEAADVMTPLWLQIYWYHNFQYLRQTQPLIIVLSSIIKTYFDAIIFWAIPNIKAADVLKPLWLWTWGLFSSTDSCGHWQLPCWSEFNDVLFKSTPITVAADVLVPLWV